MMYAAIRNHQRRAALRPITFQPVNWQPQVLVRFTRDTNGWLDRDRRVKWAFRAGSIHMIDAEHAVEFIVKGFAEGELPRPVSEEERAELLSQVTVIGLDQTSQTRTEATDG